MRKILLVIKIYLPILGSFAAKLQKSKWTASSLVEKGSGNSKKVNAYATNVAPTLVLHTKC